MDEPISYAMRNTEALSNWLNFNAPSELKDWSFLAIEFILVVGAVCSVIHAVRHYKEHGHYSALLTLLVLYTLKDARLSPPAFGLELFIPALVAAGLHAWRRNTLLSIIVATTLHCVLRSWLG